MTSMLPDPDTGATGIQRLLRPRSVAIVGLSRDPAKHGGRVLRHLRALGYGGDIYGVHPTADDVEGVEMVRSVSELPRGIDALVCAVPASALPGVIADAAAVGAGSAVIFGAGFAESGEEGRRRQAQLAAAAADSGLRILGPNSAGMVRPGLRVALSFLTSLDRPGEQIRSGPVAVVSQSGGVGSFLLNLAASRGQGLAAVVSTGNEADVTAEDVIETLAADDEVRAIGLVLEAVRDGRRFIATVEAAHAAEKPVIVLKLGTSAIGRSVMQTHTGALADARRVTAGVLEALGVTVVETPAELLDVADVVARAPVPAGPTVGVVTHSGGNAVLLADLAETQRLQLPPVPSELAEELTEYINYGAAGNPMDLGAIMSGPHRFAEVVARTARWYDTVLAVSTPHPPSFTKVRAESLLDLGHADATIVNLWLAGDVAEDGLRMLRAGGAPVVEEPRAAVKALRALVSLHQRRTQEGDTQPQRPTASATVLADLPLAAKPTEAQAKALLARWGVATARGSVVADGAAAATAATEIGFPVVVKISAAGLEHKSEVGGVRLNLQTAADVEAAADQMLAQVRSAAPDTVVEGVLVEQFRPGLELILGARHDDIFGPIVLVGLGGVLAEALDDVVVAPAPVTENGARRMLDGLRAGAVLYSTRSGRAPDLDALVALIAGFSRAFVASAQVVEEVEINPLVFSSDGWLAVDAVVRAR